MNALLQSQEILTQESIHDFRVEVKRLEAILEARSGKIDFKAGKEIPMSLEKLYHAAGSLRKFELATDAAASIIRANNLPAPAGFIHYLDDSINRHTRNLQKKCTAHPAFRPEDFLIPSQPVNKELAFLTTCSDMILALIHPEIIKDIDSLHRLRRIIKSVIYATGLYKNSADNLYSFLKNSKELLKVTESKIGSLHDVYFFVKQVSKKYSPADTGEKPALVKIKQAWKQEIHTMLEEIKMLLPPVRVFALGLKERI